MAIAYLLPGFVALLGLSFFSETVETWLTASSNWAPTVGGFLYVTLSSLAAGLTVSTIRWAVIDTIHHRTGLPQPNLNYSHLQANVSAFGVLIEDLYRYYQFYSGMFLSVAFAFSAWQISTRDYSVGMMIAVVFVEVIFWLGSRNTLKNYYSQAEMLLGQINDMDRTPQSGDSYRLPQDGGGSENGDRPEKH